MKAYMANKIQASDLEAFCCRLGATIRGAVQPYLGHPAMRKHAGIAHSGDRTFDYDLIAERTLMRAVEEEGVSIAVLSEDAGIRVYGDDTPAYTLIVDPIDGTRPACLGLEMACVSVAAVRHVPCPAFSDILAGGLVRIKEGTCLSATRGGGARISGRPLICDPSLPEPIQALYWSTEVVGRPAKEVFGRLASLIDATSREGGVFIWNSTSYALSAIADGRLDAYVDIPRRSGPVGLFAYDMAAAYLVLREAKGICTGPDGQSLEGEVLFTSGGDLPKLQAVASRNQGIHSFVLGQLGMRNGHSELD